MKWNRILVIPLIIALIGVWLLWPNSKPEAAPWYNDSWKFRKKLLIDHTKVSGGSNLSNFPVLITRKDMDLASKAQSNGNDILFTDTSGTKLDHEIESYSNGELIAWVEVPTVSPTTDTTIYMYYGNRSASSQVNATGVWDSNYKGVWHVDEGSGTRNDSTTNANNLTASGGPTATTGKIHQSNNFVAASSQNLGISNASDVGLDITGKLTIEAWVNTASAGTTQIIASKDGSSGNQGYILRYSSGNRVTFLLSPDGTAQTTLNGSTTTLTSGVWYHVAAVYDGTNMNVYLNGTSDGVSAHSTGIFNSTNDFKIGVRSTSTNPFDGNIDEVRVSSTDRSQYWIRTSYNNQSSPATFFTSVGNEEANKGPFAYWKFDEGYGTTAKETINGYNGTLTNGPQWRNESECISGMCLYFDGSNDYVSIDSMTFPAEITISSWIKTTSSAQRPVISNRSSTGYTYFGISGGRAFWYYNGSSSPSAISNKYINDNIWHHIVYTHTGDTTYIYIDGVLDNTVTQTGFVAKTDSVRIGHDVANSTEYFPGFIDEPRIYTYARTAAEIRADYAARGSTQGVSAQIGDNGPVDQLSNGLVAYYPMDETAANSCTGGTNDTCDRSGNGNDGAWNGNAANTTGKYGSGTSYDGTGDYISFTRSSAVQNITNEGTISLWTYYSTLPSDYQTGVDLATTGANGLVFFTNNTSNKPGLLYGNGSTLSGPVATSTFTTGRWYHLVGTWSPTGGKMYVNGVLDATSAHIPNISVGAGTSYIGSNDVSRYHNGSLDEVRIYNRALTPAEVSALYEWAPGPVAHWKLDENTGTSASDTSGNNINSSSFTGSPAWQPGKYGSALNFDESTNQVVTMSTNSLLDTTNVTYSAWIYPRGNSSHSYLVSRGGCTKGRLSLSNTNYLQLEVGDNSTCETLSSSSALTLNRWYYISGTIEGSSMKLYVNGDLVGSSTYSLTPVSNSTIYLGNWSSTGGAASFDGLIDDVRIYNYALTQKQIVNVMYRGSPAEASAKAGPAAHWSFDEGYGTTVNNKIPGNGNLTLWKGPSATDYPLWKNNGKFGKALQFSSSEYPYNNNAYVSSYQPWMNATSMSWSFWIYPTSISGTSRILSRRFGSGSNYTWEHRMSADDIQIVASSDCTVSTEQTLTASNVNLANTTWQHILIVHTSGSNFKVYKNGTLVDTLSYTAGLCTTATTYGFYIGTDVGVNGHLDAYMDEVKVYPYALTAQDVALDYNQGAAAVIGTTSTASDGITADSSAAREYCVPGDTSTCNPPVAEWKLDDGTGTSAQDTSGNNNTGTLTNGPTWSQGKIGKAVSFDGTDDYINVGSSVGNYTDTFTVSAWFKTTTTNSRILARRSGVSTQYDLHISSGSNRLAFYSGGTIHVGTSTVTDGQWHFGTWVINGANSQLYVDGKLETTFTPSPSISSIATDTLIGAYNAGTGVMNGSIDQVRIYNYARTPAQIAWEYNRGAPVAHYKLDECTGTTAYNSAKNGDGQAAGNNGTITIGASGGNTSAGTCTGSSGEAWKDGATGKINASLEFDGSDDYIETNSNITLDGTGESIFIWVKHTNSADVGVFTINQWYRRFFGTKWNIIDSASNYYYPTVGAVNDGNWHHVGYTLSGRNYKSYADGKLVESGTTTHDVPSVTGLIDMGRLCSGSCWVYYAGQIDDVRIYNYALTAKQVQLLYSQNAATLFAPLTGSP